ncbi:hypothetical protein LEMLEM_LOCUS15365 [Lemmus lemmus]
MLREQKSEQQKGNWKTSGIVSLLQLARLLWWNTSVSMSQHPLFTLSTSFGTSLILEQGLLGLSTW